jgi:hypothetical protein
MRLYFIHMEGCPACEAAKPELDAFQRTAAARGIEIVPVDLMKARWTFKAWSPSSTPTYVAEELGRPRIQYVGGLKKDQLAQFVAKAREMMGTR